MRKPQAGRIRESIILWLPPVFELVAASAHWADAFRWVRLPPRICSKKERPPGGWSFQIGRIRESIILWLPPVFELVAASAHWADAFRWVRLPPRICFKKERPPSGWSFLFGAGYGSRTRLHGLGSRCITDIRILHGLYYSKERRRIQAFFVIAFDEKYIAK